MSTRNGKFRRFTKDDPCPACGGWESASRGQGVRCYGFISDDGEFVHCTREELSKACKYHKGSQTYSHRLHGLCPCGKEHRPGPVANGNPRHNGEPVRQTLERVYDYQNPDGTLRHQTLRYRLPDGDKTFSQRRPNGKGRWIRKNVFVGFAPVLYKLPELLAASPDEPVWIVEGEKDVDNLRALGLVATCNPMGACRWRDEYAAHLAGRHCLIIPDNDPPDPLRFPLGQGREHAQQVARSLSGKAASVKIVELPGLPPKGDVSDFLASGGTVEQLDELASQATEWGPGEWRPSTNGNGQSPPTTHAIAEGSRPSYGNFMAKITREITRHEAGETTRYAEVEAIHVDGTKATVTVAAEEFEAMGWVPAKLGMKFAIRTGRGAKDRFQHSIRVSSYPGVEEVEVFTSMGWHTIDGRNVYLHAGGAIGSNKPVAVELVPELHTYRLPTPDLTRFKEGTEKVLAIMGALGPEAGPVGAIIVSLPFRALLGPSRSVPHFAGTTGTYKTSTATLAVRFFAPELEFCDAMPCTWQSTQAGLERIRHVAKDSLVIVDNLIADGEHAHRELAKADSVINSQGDLAGKARMQADGSQAPRMDPRGTMISTGECEPRRRSAVGRSIIIEFKPKMIDFNGLDRCHADARAGSYAQTVACYADHLARGDNLREQRDELQRLAREYQAKAKAACPGCHPRHAEAVAEWTAGLQLFLRFAVKQHAVTKQTSDLFLKRVREELFLVLPMQAEIQEEADVGEVYMDVIRASLASKRAVLVGIDGLAPGSEIAAACGWQRTEVSQRGGETIPQWNTAHGATIIGWIDGGHVYLNPAAAYSAAKRLASDQGESLGSKRQVHSLLAEKGQIEVPRQTPGTRRRFTQRIWAEKRQVDVLKIPHGLLFSGEESGME
ncbi:MAG: hypothetical protein JO161_04890 [Planctomycetaceae bacterium]|nr:hypothetical protein [Planctomycetaceae bacterium]